MADAADDDVDAQTSLEEAYARLRSQPWWLNVGADEPTFFTMMDRTPVPAITNEGVEFVVRTAENLISNKAMSMFPPTQRFVCAHRCQGYEFEPYFFHLFHMARAIQAANLVAGFRRAFLAQEDTPSRHSRTTTADLTSRLLSRCLRSALFHVTEMNNVRATRLPPVRDMPGGFLLDNRLRVYGIAVSLMEGLISFNRGDLLEQSTLDHQVRTLVEANTMFPDGDNPARTHHMVLHATLDSVIEETVSTCHLDKLLEDAMRARVRSWARERFFTENYATHPHA